jgi:hypothetical protein
MLGPYSSTANFGRTPIIVKRLKSSNDIVHSRYYNNDYGTARPVKDAELN